MEEPDKPDMFKLHAFESKHKHELDAEIPFNLLDYFSRIKCKRFTYKAHYNSRSSGRDWKGEFMKSLTYELTTIYADQMA